MPSIQFSLPLITLAEQIVKLHEAHELLEISNYLSKIEAARANLQQQLPHSIEDAQSLYDELKQKYISITAIENLANARNNIAAKLPSLGTNPSKELSLYDAHIAQLECARFGMLADVLISHKKIDAVKDFVME